MFASTTILKSVLKLSHYAGFHAIGNVRYSNSAKFLTNIYLSTIFVMFFSQIIGLAMTLVLKLSGDDGSGPFCVFVIMINNVILIIFYTVKEREIARNYRNMASFVETILEDPDSGEFAKEVTNYANLVNKFIWNYMISVYVLLVLEFLIKGLTYMKIIELVTEENALIYVLPWEINNATFWPTLVFQVVSTAIMTVVQQANHYYLMTMMILQTLCFRHLRKSLNYVLKPRKSYRLDLSQLHLLKPLNERSYKNKNNSWHYESNVEEDVEKWIGMHTQLLSLCREFVNIYSPLLVSYFLVMFVILISGVFAITQNHHYYGLTEKILLGLYFTGIIFNLFILSIAPEAFEALRPLSFESVRTFEDAFHAPWYNHGQRVQTSLKVVCEAAKRPVRLAAFNSLHFNMSLHTFLWVMRTMVSFYIGLVQIKERSSQRDN